MATFVAWNLSGRMDERASTPAAASYVAAAPNSNLTPGAVLTTDVSSVCQPGYASAVRAFNGRVPRAAVLARYGLSPGTRDVVIDHRVPLELGGSPSAQNLWPEPAYGPSGSHVKDRLENRLHQLVCRDRSMTLADAQKVFLGDWTALLAVQAGYARSSRSQ